MKHASRSRDRYKDSVVGIESVSGDLTKRVIHLATQGAKFLESIGRLGSNNVVSLSEDRSFMSAQPVMVKTQVNGERKLEPLVIGIGASSKVVKMDMDIPGMTAHGYVRKEYYLSDDMSVQAAARTIIHSLDRNIKDNISPVIGFFEPQNNVLYFYQELQPYTMADVLGFLKREIGTIRSTTGADKLRENSEYGNSLLAIGYLMLEYTTMVNTFHQSGLVNRDEKPANVGVALKILDSREGRTTMYDAKVIDQAEILAVNGLAESMPVEYRKNLNVSGSCNAAYAPSRFLRYLRGDEQVSALKIAESDSVTQLGYVFSSYLFDMYDGIPKDASNVEKNVLNARERFRISDCLAFDESLDLYLPVMKRATDEQRTETGAYDMATFHHEMTDSVLQLCMDLTMKGYVSESFKPSLPKRLIGSGALSGIDGTI